VGSGIIRSDRDFDIIRPGSAKDQTQEGALITACTRWIGKQTCVSPSGDALVYSSERAPVQQMSSFAVVLRNSNLDRNFGLGGWTVVGIATITSFFLLIGYGIRRKEKDLLKRIKLLNQAINRVPHLIGVPSTEKDTFEAASSTIEQLIDSLEQRSKLIGTYQVWLKRQTRRDQLQQTLAYSAHDFRAPLEETADFIRHLPSLIQALSPEELKESTVSLENRVRAGLRSLDNALRSTAAQADESLDEVFVLEDSIAVLKDRVRSHPRVRQSQVLFASGAGVLLKGNRDAFEAALWNLIENSAQAHLGATVQISLHAPAGFPQKVSIHVTDDGPGIPPELREDIFGEFVSTKPYGTGLGLPSARRAIESMQGSLQALPSDKGAVFEIVLPAMLVSPDAEGDSRFPRGERHV
jgi:signal transduction histidine kinase